MGTTIRAELSKRNKFWIEKHRYYELKHFCLQYPNWKKLYDSLDGMSKRTLRQVSISGSGNIDDPTAKCAEKREYCMKRMAMIEGISRATDETLADYIIKGVTEGLSYDVLKVQMNIPCSKDVYYEAYREFFWLLDQVRK